MNVPDKVKAELKRFLTPRQVDELSKQLDNYEKRVRDAVKQFDAKSRVAKAKGQEQLDRLAAQVKKTGQQLEKQLKTFMQQEGKNLNQGLNELVGYFRSGAKPKAASAVKKVRKATKPAKTVARKSRARSK